MPVKSDSAIQRRPNGPLMPSQWFYVLDGNPECNGVAAMHHLKALGFSTEEAGQYMRALQSPVEPVPMDPSEERHFQL